MDGRQQILSRPLRYRREFAQRSATGRKYADGSLSASVTIIAGGR